MKNLKRFISFCLIGGLAAFVELAFFNLIYFFTYFFVLSKVVGISISLLFNFFSNRKFTFRASKGKIKKQMPKFLVVYGMAFFINLSVSSMVNHFLPGGSLYANMAAISGILAQIPFSFFGSLKWTFRKNEK